MLISAFQRLFFNTWHFPYNIKMQRHINTYYNDNKCGLKHVYYKNGNLVLGGVRVLWRYFWGGLTFVTKCDEWGQKSVKIMWSFMDGPYVLR